MKGHFCCSAIAASSHRQNYCKVSMRTTAGATAIVGVIQEASASTPSSHTSNRATVQVVQVLH